MRHRTKDNISVSDIYQMSETFQMPHLPTEEKTVSLPDPLAEPLSSPQTPQPQPYFKRDGLNVRASHRHRFLLNSQVPWDDETDHDQMLTYVKSIKMDGLGCSAHKLIPISYHMEMLQVMREKIEEFEDFVQSCDVIAMNNILHTLLSFIGLLAPTGALIVIVCYYIYIMSAQPLFEICSISANIYSFSF